MWRSRERRVEEPEAASQVRAKLFLSRVPLVKGDAESRVPAADDITGVADPGPAPKSGVYDARRLFIVIAMETRVWEGMQYDCGGDMRHRHDVFWTGCFPRG